MIEKHDIVYCDAENKIIGSSEMYYSIRHEQEAYSSDQKREPTKHICKNCFDKNPIEYMKDTYYKNIIEIKVSSDYMHILGKTENLT